jgi:hypothetical protein
MLIIGFQSWKAWKFLIVDDTLVKIRDSFKASAEVKVGILETHRNKSWFDQECSELANKRKQAKLLWLQNPSDQIAEDLTNIRHNTFTKKTHDYMKAEGWKTERTKIFRKFIRVLMN